MAAMNPMFANVDSEVVENEVDDVAKLDVFEAHAENAEVGDENHNSTTTQNNKKSNRNKIIGGVAALGLVAAAAAVGLVMYGQSKKPAETAEEEKRTKLSVLKLTDDEAVGEIDCIYAASGEPHEFSWRSTPGVISLVHKQQATSKPLLGYNNFAGITMSIDSEPDFPGIEFLVHRFGQEPGAFIVNEETILSEAETHALDSIVSGYVGACLIELSFELGKEGLFAKDSKQVAPLHQLSKLFFNFAKGMPTTWDQTELNMKKYVTSVEVENMIREKDVVTAKSGMKPTEESLLDPAKVQIQHMRGDIAALKASCTSIEWFRLGDGHCDPVAMTPDCNFDNGDCCSATCKNYGQLWGGQSPPDGNDQRHPVFNCNTEGDIHCVPDCPVQDQYFNYLGDGYCDPELNIASCGFDLGDCCEGTCADYGKEYYCGQNGYNCKSGRSGMCHRDHCGNPEFGMCGASDSCWKWVCGDCYCQEFCTAHDEYCSCDGQFTLKCLNVFAVYCD